MDKKVIINERGKNLPIPGFDLLCLQAIMDKMPNKILNCLEVGCGLSTVAMLKRGNVTILEIDPDRGTVFKGLSYGDISFNKMACDPNAKCKVVDVFIGRSEDYRSDKTFDIVFIDGDHRYSKIRKDIDNLFPMVRAGGFISGHDYEGGGYNEEYIEEDFVERKHHGVIKAVDETFKDKVNKGGHCVWWVQK